jgi:hypothetical protein
MSKPTTKIQQKRGILMKIERALIEIKLETLRATAKHISFQSQHEGYAIIKEELDKLWAEIKKIHNLRERNANIRKEAIQVGAMAVRFLMDLYEE